MNTVNFIIILIGFLVVFYIFNKKENFNTDSQISNQTSNQGLYNWFFQSYMNPYSEPLTKFFTNDREGKVNLSK